MMTYAVPAQMVPARPAASPDGFLPRQLAGCLLWLAADQLLGFSSGDPVGMWTDLSFQGNHATQATASKKPVYQLQVISDKPVVRFDGVDDYLACSGITKNTLPTAADVTLIALARPTVMGTAQTLLYLGNYNVYSPNWHWVGIQKPTNDKFEFANYDGSGHSSVADAAAVQNTPYLLVGRRQDNINYLSINGAQQATPVASGAPNISASAILRIASDEADSAHFGVDVAEVILYNRALVASELSQLYRYLSDKYGLTVVGI